MNSITHEFSNIILPLIIFLVANSMHSRTIYLNESLWTPSVKRSALWIIYPPLYPFTVDNNKWSDEEGSRGINWNVSHQRGERGIAWQSGRWLLASFKKISSNYRLLVINVIQSSSSNSCPSTLVIQLMSIPLNGLTLALSRAKRRYNGRRISYRFNRSAKVRN